MRAQIPLMPGARRPWLTLLCLGVAVALYLQPEAAAALIYDRCAIGRGELWRLLTGHLVHWSTLHLIVDAAAFGLAAAAIERTGRPLGALLGILAAGIGLFLWLTLPDMAFYGGLSGLGYGLITYAALALPGACSAWRRPARIAAVALAVKVLLEIGLNSAMPCVPGQEFVPLPQSHAAGMVIAWLFRVGDNAFGKYSGNGF